MTIRLLFDTHTHTQKDKQKPCVSFYEFSVFDLAYGVQTLRAVQAATVMMCELSSHDVWTFYSHDVWTCYSHDVWTCYRHDVSNVNANIILKIQSDQIFKKKYPVDVFVVGAWNILCTWENYSCSMPRSMWKYRSRTFGL